MITGSNARSMVLGFNLALLVGASACSGGDPTDSPESQVGGSATTTSSGGNVGKTSGKGGSSTSTQKAKGGTSATDDSGTEGGANAQGGADAEGGESSEAQGGKSSSSTKSSSSKAVGGTSSSSGSKASGGSSAASGSKATGGGTANGGAGGTSTASTSTSECGVDPVDPDATPEAKKLLCYLYSIYKKNVLSGQQETSWNPNPNDDVEYYNTLVGKYPAVLGGDYLYPSGTTTRAKDWWNKGGIVMLRYHMGAPPSADTYDNSKLGFTPDQWKRLFTDGSAENTKLFENLDYLAKELKILQDANVPVLLALYHEVQVDGWFWWSKGTAAQFIQLWNTTHDYLVKTKGIHNIIRLLPYSGSPSGEFYPGKENVDIGGADEYSLPADQPFSRLYTACSKIFGSTMPIPLHETGTIPQPDQMFPTAAPWLLWNTWAGYYKGSWNAGSGTSVEFNTEDGIKKAYASPYTLTRDELPDLK